MALKQYRRIGRITWSMTVQQRAWYALIEGNAIGSVFSTDLAGSPGAEAFLIGESVIELYTAPSTGGGLSSVSDGTTSVAGPTSLLFAGATVSDAGGGVADVAVLVIENDNQVAASGAGTVTIPDVTVDTINEITLTGNPTLAFPTGAAGKSFTMMLTQDATGGRTVTWPSTATLIWPSGAAPTLTVTASKTDVFSFVWSAQRSRWLGFVSGQNF